MANRLLERLRGSLEVNRNKRYNKTSFLRNVVAGSFYKVSDIRGNTDINDIRTKIETMRALAQDSQVSTALSYYATDATTTNTKGQIIWATSEDHPEIATIINSLFKKWKINSYARDHILELATVGNLYIPTTYMYHEYAGSSVKMGVSLDNNTIVDEEFDIIPSYKIPPEDIVHIWYQGNPQGYIYQPEVGKSDFIIYPENAVIHFSLGGLLGEYTISSTDATGNSIEYDIMFAEPLMNSAVLPTQTLNLLEDAVLLSSMIRVVKFINVDCSDTEDDDEIADALQQIKDAIEQQLAIDTTTGSAQSFLNPNSPNNLIYLPKVNGSDAISITDLDMAQSTEADNKLLEYYQDKKLSVLGVPKEAMNFSSNEGLGGAGAVMSQRSALYANILDRLMTAYKSGWTDALNAYFITKNMSGYVDQFELHMNPIITTQSTIQFEKRDAALNQAMTLVDLLQKSGVKESKPYLSALVEILSEVFPQTGADAACWNIDMTNPEGGGTSGF